MLNNRLVCAEKLGNTTWTKHYCSYQKDKKEFTMIPYNQMTGKFVSVKLFIFYKPKFVCTL